MITEKETTKVLGFKTKEKHLAYKSAKVKDETMADMVETIPYTWERYETSDLVSNEDCIIDKELFKSMLAKANVQRKSEARSSATRVWYQRVGDYRASKGASLEDKAVRDLVKLGMSEAQARKIVKELANANQGD